jgi:hypothetical protein
MYATYVLSVAIFDTFLFVPERPFSTKFQDLWQGTKLYVQNTMFIQITHFPLKTWSYFSVLNDFRLVLVTLH